jgi:phage gp16-like protein
MWYDLSMKIKISKKKMTLEDLAIMVAKGFENTATKADIAKLDKKIDSVKSELKSEIQGLRNSVNNYLKLTDKRYLELKNNQKILVK